MARVGGIAMNHIRNCFRVAAPALGAIPETAGEPGRAPLVISIGVMENEAIATGDRVARTRPDFVAGPQSPLDKCNLADLNGRA